LHLQAYTCYVRVPLTYSKDV